MEYLQILREIGEILGSNQAPQVFFKTALEKCLRFTNADKGSIIRIDEEHQTLDIIHQVGLGSSAARNIKLKIGEGVTGIAAKEQRVIRLDDVSKSRDYVAVNPEIKSEMAVPIVHRSQVLGVISVDSIRKHSFTAEHEELLNIVATQFGQALIAHESNEELKRHIGYDNQLLEINRILSSSLDLNQTFEQVLSVLKRSGQFEKGALILRNEGNDALEIRACFGYSKAQARKGVYRIDEGVVGKVYRTQKPMAIRDINADAYFLNKTGSRDMSGTPKSFYCIPLIMSSKVIGIMIFDRAYEGKKVFQENFTFLKMLESQITKSLQIHMLARNATIELEKENRELKDIFTDQGKFGAMIGRSPAIVKVFNQIKAVAMSDSSVLITGESGTGKELVAAAIHYNSTRREKSFIAVNCASIPVNLLESELFGYKKGSFTGANADKPGKFNLADNGTIFLDEIGELPLQLQSSLLRVLQEGVVDPIGGQKSEKVNVRVLAATNRNLGEEIEKKNFREDLYYRLSIIPIALPSLKERREDIPLLVKYFLDEYRVKYTKNDLTITESAVKQLLEYDWAGNIRELRNVLERSVIFSQNSVIDTIYFDQLVSAEKGRQHMPMKPIEMGLEEVLEARIKQMTAEEGVVLKKLHDLVDHIAIDKALRLSRGIHLKAAELLGISRETLRKRVEELKIDIYG